MNNKLSVITFIICLSFFTNVLQAYSLSVQGEQKPLVLRAEENNVANFEMVIKDNFVKAKYASAENRFLQGNIKAAAFRSTTFMEKVYKKSTTK